VFDVTSTANPIFLAAALSSDIKNSGVARCAVQNRAGGPVLLAFVDSAATWIGNNPAFVAFSLQNPAQPQLIAGTGVPKRFFRQSVYSSDGNTAFVVTSAQRNFFGYDNQFGDVVAVNVSNLASPAVAGTMEPQIDATFGGANSMFGAALANPTTLLVGGSTSTGPTNNGVGELVVADVTTPSAISIVTTLPVPNTKQIFRPALQGNLAVALGDTDGMTSPGVYLGNLVLTTFDIADPRNPAILASIVLPYLPAKPGPAVPIGVNLFLFGGALDTAGNNLLLLVDTTNPRSPIVTPYSVPALVTDLAVTGTVLHVTRRCRLRPVPDPRRDGHSPHRKLRRARELDAVSPYGRIPYPLRPLYRPRPASPPTRPSPSPPPARPIPPRPPTPP
jgi:hypothetical protein